MSGENFKNFSKLVEIIRILRSPEGCPWDREQDHLSLRKNLLEETYEALEAIESGNANAMKEELGDVLLQVVLHAQIASETKDFDIEDVAKTISDKLIRRHPHVFSDVKVKDSEEVMVNWDEIKRKEKPERKSALSGVAKNLPALLMAAELSKKAVKTGFEWPSEDSLWECFESEIKEFKEADKTHQEEELGDILFCLVNVARWHGIDPELALLKANRKFDKRFRTMENLACKELEKYNFDEFDELWRSAKKHLQNEDK